MTDAYTSVTERTKAVALIGHAPVGVFDTKQEAWDWANNRDELTEWQLDSFHVQSEVSDFSTTDTDRSESDE